MRQRLSGELNLTRQERYGSISVDVRKQERGRKGWMKNKNLKKRKDALQMRIDFISSAIRENKIEHHQLQRELHEHLKEFEIKKIQIELERLKEELKELNKNEM